MSRTRTVEESRWNVASRFASLLHGAIRNNGVPVLAVGFVAGVLAIAALVELAKVPNPVCELS